jgi:hypothetical protein
VLAGFKKAANFAWSRVPTGKAEPLFQMSDCLLNLIEIIGYRRHLPGYSCLIRGQCNVETYPPPDVLGWAAYASEER